MAEEGTQESSAPEGQAPKGTDPGDGDSAEVERWKGASRKNEADLKRALGRLSAIEDQGRTEAEKHASRATEAEKRADAAEAKVLRLEIADEAGIKPAHRKYLIGTSDTELRESAKELRALFPEAYSEAPASAGRAGVAQRPVEALKPGQVAVGATGASGSDDANEWFRNYANQNRRRVTQ